MGIIENCLQSPPKSGKLMVESGWLICPICRRKKLMRIRPETQARSLQIYCRGCRNELIIDIDKGECSRSHGQ